MRFRFQLALRLAGIKSRLPYGNEPCQGRTAFGRCSIQCAITAKCRSGFCSRICDGCKSHYLENEGIDPEVVPTQSPTIVRVTHSPPKHEISLFYAGCRSRSLSSKHEYLYIYIYIYVYVYIGVILCLKNMSAGRKS